MELTQPDVSPDGTALMCHTPFSTTSSATIYRWTASAGLVLMKAVPIGAERWIGLDYSNSNGTTVIGEYSDQSNQNIFRWTSAGWNEAIGLSGYENSNLIQFNDSVSADGTVIAESLNCIKLLFS